MNHPDLLTAIADFIGRLNDAGLDYLVGGSVASSIYGIYRSTNDADFVVRIEPRHVIDLVTLLEADYYVDGEMILDAIATKTAFNVIHLETMAKIDAFVQAPTAWAAAEWKRRRVETIDAPPHHFQIILSSPEDVVLHKLEWYRIGNMVSDRQWKDVVELLMVQGLALDVFYMDDWARAIGVEDLLERAFAEANLPE